MNQLIPLYLYSPAKRVWREYPALPPRQCSRCKRPTRGILLEIRTGKKRRLCETCAYPPPPTREATAA
jgi:hypothetical protein